MMSKLEEAYDFDIRIRLYDDRAAPTASCSLPRTSMKGSRSRRVA
jgi:hypothetical protein